MRSRTQRMRRSAGFSMLELMLVLAVIGVLMSVVAISFMSGGQRAKTKATMMSMDTIKGALLDYSLTHGSFPQSLEVLRNAGTLDKSKPLKDGWKRDFIYSPQGRDRDRPFTLGSAGPNGQAGDDDDIDVWTMHEQTN
jgi:general secretion pathway protein G